jgi:hypothetical protein
MHNFFNSKFTLLILFTVATIGRITELLSRGKINISNIDIVIIQVGTNNISSAQYVDTSGSFPILLIKDFDTF